MIDYATHPLVERGYQPHEIAFADTMLALFRALHVVQLMRESGHPEWEGRTEDDISAFVATTSDMLGIKPGDPESDKAVQEFISFRMRRLESMPYDEYLLTPEWKDVRRFALWRAGDRCQTCNAKARLQVHHRTYEHRGHEHLDDVTVLCGACHKAFHENRGLSRV